jgi:cytosine/adenosine deaminase-related metal-dependent hydrolase
MFTVARMALGSQRALDNAHSRETEGKLPETSTIHCREALEWITIRGAQAMKMDDRIGSLAVGKQADIVLVRASDLNMWPVHDPVTSLVMQTSLANIDTVMIAGVVKKRHGKLLHTGIEAGKEKLAASGRRILQALRAAAH